MADDRLETFHASLRDADMLHTQVPRWAFPPPTTGSWLESVVLDLPSFGLGDTIGEQSIFDWAKIFAPRGSFNGVLWELDLQAIAHLLHWGALGVPGLLTWFETNGPRVLVCSAEMAAGLEKLRMTLWFL